MINNKIKLYFDGNIHILFKTMVQEINAGHVLNETSALFSRQIAGEVISGV